MRILHINNNYAATGGAQTYLLGVMRRLEALGHRNSIIYHQRMPGTLHVEGRGEYWVPLAADRRSPGLLRRLAVGASDAWYLYGQPALRQACNQVRRVLEEENPDVTYLHMVSHPEIVGEALRHGPVVAYVHGFFPCCPANIKMWRSSETVCTVPFGARCAAHIYLHRCSNARHPASVLRSLVLTREAMRLYRRVDRILVASRYVRDLFVQNGFQAEQIRILPYFIGRNAGLAAPNCRQEGEAPVVLFVGRVAEEKGLPYLLRAMAEVRRGYRLVVAGDGPLLPACRRLAADLGIGGRVEFRGWLEGPALEQAYLECALVAVPSVCPEAFGQVGPEAMLRGRPVVGFAVGGIPDWLEDGRNGFLVEPRNVRQMAERIAMLLADNDLAERFGEKGREMVAERYSAESHLAALLDIFRAVSSGPQTREG